MQTISLNRAETRAISIAAPPEAVLRVIADPRRLPDWAPGFAQTVEPAGDHWLVSTGDGKARIRVRVSAEHGTVDLLAAGSPGTGAFMRVLPNRAGSELLFTLFFPRGTEEPVLTAQMATVQEELETVRRLSLAPGARAA